MLNKDPNEIAVKAYPYDRDCSQLVTLIYLDFQKMSQNQILGEIEIVSYLCPPEILSPDALVRLLAIIKKANCFNKTAPVTSDDTAMTPTTPSMSTPQDNPDAESPFNTYSTLYILELLSNDLDQLVDTLDNAGDIFKEKLTTKPTPSTSNSASSETNSTPSSTTSKPPETSPSSSTTSDTTPTKSEPETTTEDPYYVNNLIFALQELIALETQEELIATDGTTTAFPPTVMKTFNAQIADDDIEKGLICLNKFKRGENSQEKGNFVEEYTKCMASYN